MRVVLGPMSARDLDEVERIAGVSFAPPWTRAAFEGELGSPIARCSVARSAAEGASGEGPLVGFAVARLLGPEAELLSIASAPSVRRRGVGRALLVELLDDLDGRAVEACFLEVRAGNAPALALYESHGFTRLDVRKAYYEDGEDALILVRRSTSAT